jgi:putative spermidine/putrescine transport system permease protein
MAMTSQRCSRWFILTQVAAWCCGLFLLLPIFVAIPVAFTDRSYISVPSGTDWTFRHFAALAEGRWGEAAVNSLSIGLAVATITSVLGVGAAIALWRAAPNVRVVGRAIFLAPLVVPPIIIGLALYRPWVQLGLIDTWLGVVLSHSIVALPLVVVIVSASLSSIDPRIDDAARNLGASRRQRVIHVVLPNIRTSVIAGAVLAFITSWDEFVITLFLTQRRLTTLPLTLFQGIKDNFDPVIAAVAVLLVACTTLVFAVGGVRRSISRSQLG